MNLKSIKSVTVYCSSSNNVNKKFFKLAKDLGVFLAYKNIRIIYGGGSSGLIGTVSRNAILNGGKVTGIIPDFLVSKENINYKISKIIVVKSMSVRKKLLFISFKIFATSPILLYALSSFLIIFINIVFKFFRRFKCYNISFTYNFFF